MKKPPRRPAPGRDPMAVHGAFADIYDFRPDLRDKAQPSPRHPDDPDPVIVEGLATFDRMTTLIAYYSADEPARAELREEARRLVLHIAARVHRRLGDAPEKREPAAARGEALVPLRTARPDDGAEEEIGHDARIARAEGELAATLRRRGIAKAGRSGTRRLPK